MVHGTRAITINMAKKDPMLVEFCRAGQRGQCGSVWSDSVRKWFLERMNQNMKVLAGQGTAKGYLGNRKSSAQTRKYNVAREESSAESLDQGRAKMAMLGLHIAGSLWGTKPVPDISNPGLPLLWGGRTWHQSFAFFSTPPITTKLKGLQKCPQRWSQDSFNITHLTLSVAHCRYSINTQSGKKSHG